MRCVPAADGLPRFGGQRAVDHGAGNLLERGLRPCLSLAQARDDRFLTRAARDKVQRVHRARLPYPIDAAHALFEPQRRPRKLQVDDQTAARVQIQPFARRIGREQHSGSAVRECARGAPPLQRRHAAVHRHDRYRQPPDEVAQRVAVLGEDQDGLPDAAEQADEHGNLALSGGRPSRERQQTLERPVLVARVDQARRRKNRGRFIVVSARLDEREGQLGPIEGRACQKSATAFDRVRKGRGAAVCPAHQHRHREPGAGMRVGRLVPDAARVGDAAPRAWPPPPAKA